MPTALDAGRYHSKGLRVQRQVHGGFATGLPAPSTCASAASNSAEITGVECSRNSGPYSRQVEAGDFTRAWATGKNISVGFRQTCTTQFAATQIATRTPRTRPTRTATGAAQNRRSVRPVFAKNRRRCSRSLKTGFLRGRAEATRDEGMGFEIGMLSPYRIR